MANLTLSHKILASGMAHSRVYNDFNLNANIIIFPTNLVITRLSARDETEAKIVEVRPIPKSAVSDKRTRLLQYELS